MTHKHEQQLIELSVFVHGALATLHLLGSLYHLRRRNWWDVLAHTSAATYDACAFKRHLDDLKD